MIREFSREEHVYKSSAFEEIIKDTLRFFNGTPVVKISPIERFHGTGIYALYYIGELAIYKKLALQNRIAFAQPIYVGKAVPKGWRKARHQHYLNKKSYELNGRIREHQRSLECVQNLDLGSFMCRFMVLEGVESDLIGTVEAALIRYYAPIWNTQIEGFGNHDPGKGRYNQAKSDWDILHPGRPWVNRLQGKKSTSLDIIEGQILEYFKKNKK